MKTVTVGFGIAVSAQVNAGFGKHQSALSTEQIPRMEQVSSPNLIANNRRCSRLIYLGLFEAAYTSQVLYVISLCLARLALLQFLVHLARTNLRRKVVIAVMIFNCILVMIAILCVAFQCPLPHPWAIFHHRCFDQVSDRNFEPEPGLIPEQRAFWIAFGVQDIAADVATILLSICLLYDLHVERRQKSPIIMAFAARAL